MKSRHRMSLEPIYIDIEATFDENIQEVGLVYKEDELKTTSIKEAFEYIQATPTRYITGHNIIAFDKRILETSSIITLLENKTFIDTLPVSLLLFNEIFSLNFLIHKIIYKKVYISNVLLTFYFVILMN